MPTSIYLAQRTKLVIPLALRNDVLVLSTQATNFRITSQSVLFKRHIYLIMPIGETYS